MFDVAVGERAISHTGHIEMMAAAQPFISGAISKTVNLPESATVEDIADAYTQGWKLGLKALAIYRDGSKTAQALRTDAGEKRQSPPRPRRRGPQPERRKMPRERESITHKFSIAGARGLHHRRQVRGRLGRRDLPHRHRQGGLDAQGMMNAFATAISIGLQYGVPLETFVKKFSYMRFEPEGITTNPEIPFAKSMPDYIMRWLASRFIDDTDYLEDLGILTPEVRARKDAQQALPIEDGSAARRRATGTERQRPLQRRGEGGDRRAQGGGKAGRGRAHRHPTGRPRQRWRACELGPACEQCGGMMQRTGSCYTCSSCGNNTGCG